MTQAHSLSIRKFFSGTTISRASGMIREILMTAIFGAHPSVAAFLVAFRFANFLRRILGEGPFQSAFTPYFEELRLEDESSALYFFHKLTLWMVLLLTCLIAIFQGIIWSISLFFQIPPAICEILQLTSILLPGSLFICLYGLNLSLLHSYNSFFIPSIAPTICNLIWILGIYKVKDASISFAMKILAKWVVFGFIGQWLLTFIYVKKFFIVSWKEWFKPIFLSKIASLMKTLGISVLGVAALQVNGCIDAIMARYIDLRGPTYLWYGIRIQQLLLALIGISCVNTIIPYLTKTIKSSNIPKAQDIFQRTFRLIITIMIPCIFAIFGLGITAVNLLYGRGHYSPYAILQTGLCLWGYGIGLLPSTMVILFSSIFYAYYLPRIPLRISIITVIINVILNGFCIVGMQCGVFAIAAMTSISSWVNCYLLYRELRNLGWRPTLLISSTMHLFYGSIFALICCVSIYPTSVLALFGNESHSLPRILSKQLTIFFIQGCVFWGSFLMYSFIFKKNNFISCLKELFSKKIKIETQIESL